jgi:hypothetical protein
MTQMKHTPRWSAAVKEMSMAMKGMNSITDVFQILLWELQEQGRRFGEIIHRAVENSRWYDAISTMMRRHSVIAPLIKVLKFQSMR